MLSLLNSQFDPLGLVLPFLMQGRMLLARTRQEHKDWDDPLAEAEILEWKKWASQIPLMTKAKVTRWIRLEPDSQIHVFGDASNDGYGCVAYLLQGKTVTLLFARGHANSNRALTIPRLELEAAVIVSLMAHRLSRLLELPSEQVWQWSDSSPVLHQIKAPHRKLDDYTSRKVAQIRGRNCVANWRHVPTEQNPADVLSRGCNMKALLAHSLWWAGPEFLCSSNWPEIKVEAVADLEVPNLELWEQMLAHQAVSEGKAFGEQIATRLYKTVSTLSRLVRVFRTLLRVAEFGSTGVLPAREKYDWKAGWRALLCFDQSWSFGTERLVIAKGGRPPGKLFLQTDVQLKDGLLLAGGRLPGVLLPLLNRDSPLSLLWLQYLHGVELKHVGGQGTLWSECKRQIMIWQGAVLSKKVIKNCITCKRVKAVEREQKMGPLPPVRLANISGEAFENTSVDFAGPFLIKPFGSRRGFVHKAFVLVIVCMATRALHLEMTMDQKADSVLLALQRFSSLRRMPRMIYSDNAGDFLHCAKIMDEARLQPDPHQTYFQSWRDLRWEFSTPASPHTNGVTEIMVKLTKKGLMHITKGVKVPSEEVFRTMLSVTAELVNRRPIAIMPNDSQDLVPLTPQHFLGGSSQLATGLPVEHSSSIVQRWDQMQEIREKLWERFEKEILPELFKRPKWHNELPPIQVNDVVIVLECPKTLGRWPLGRVIRVQKGLDGVIRGVTVKVGDRTYWRHPHLIVPLF